MLRKGLAITQYHVGRAAKLYVTAYAGATVISLGEKALKAGKDRLGKKSDGGK